MACDHSNQSLNAGAMDQADQHGHEAAPVKGMREERQPPRPDVDEMAPGIGRIQLPISLPGLGHVNCYVLEDDRGVTLVDPGLPGYRTWRHLNKMLASVDIPIQRVHTVVVTHSHPDHFGQIPRLRKATGAEVITHRNFRTFLDPEAEADDEDLEIRPADDTTDHADADVLRPIDHDGPGARSTPWGGKPFQLPMHRRLTYTAMRHVGGRIWGTPTPTRRVDDAEVLVLGGREWVSVHTPGHTTDHLCLWSPSDGLMISGDHVLPTITPHISGTNADRDPLASFFASLQKMESYDGVSTVLPAHGYEFTDLSGRAAAIGRHHHERLDVLRRAGDDLGKGTVEQYMRVLFKERSWGSMAESETFAHLKHLVFADDADVDSSGSELRFSMRG